MWLQPVLPMLGCLDGSWEFQCVRLLRFLLRVCFLRKGSVALRKRLKNCWPTSTFSFCRWRDDPESIKHLFVTQAVGGRVAGWSPNILAVKINDLSFIPYLMWKSTHFLIRFFASISHEQIWLETSLQLGHSHPLAYFLKVFNWEFKNLYLKFAFLSHLLSAQSVDTHA